MKKLCLSLFLFLGFGSLLLAQNYPPQSDLLWVTTPNSNDWLYKLNQEATVSVALYRYGSLMDDVKISYSIGPELMPSEIEGHVTLINGKGVVSLGTLAYPGFKDCKFSVTVGGKEYRHHIKVGFEPEKLTPYTNYPDDFDSFWRDAMHE